MQENNEPVPASAITPTSGHQSTPSASNVTPGIAAILEAEREANRIVEEARKCTLFVCVCIFSNQPTKPKHN